MTSLSRYSRHLRRDRLSVNVVPEQSRDTEPQSPYLHWLFVKNSEDDTYSRLTDTSAESVHDIDGYSTAEAVIMKEVAAWLELCEHDDFWAAKGKHARKAVLPTTSQLLARWKVADSSLPNNHDGTSAFEAFVKSIALQLLASCYTVLPATSANAPPLFQQRTGEKIVTALCAHALYRLAPAAGHQARAPSETSPWPALYTGLDPEDVLAETSSNPRDPTSDQLPKTTQRPGRDSLIEDTVRYKYDIPAVRRVSATPHASQKTKSLLSARSAGNGDLMFSGGTPGERKPAMSGVSRLQLGFSQSIGPSPFSAPQTEASNGYFSLESSAVYGNGHREMDADELNPRFSSPNYHKIVRNIYNHDNLSFDANGQTAQDRLNDLVFGTEMGHNSQQRSSSPVRGEPAEKPEPNAYPPPDQRIHSRLTTDKNSMYDNDAEPNLVSDPRLRRKLTKRRRSSDVSSSDDGLDATGRKGSQEFVVRARRRKSIGYPAGQHDEELVRRFSLTWEEKMRFRQ
ncbi:hypothetical protein E8E11_004065 [Didymella keratinophila]|nr:hypothetical protein E8E11_004065 [Didymella keratinophila]